jgi:hypothetical protein
MTRASCDSNACVLAKTLDLAQLAADPQAAVLADDGPKCLLLSRPLGTACVFALLDRDQNSQLLIARRRLDFSRRSLALGTSFAVDWKTRTGRVMLANCAEFATRPISSNGRLGQRSKR